MARKALTDVPLEAVSAEVLSRVQALHREAEEAKAGDLAELSAKSVAVASGKGGVGKTITAVNLALYFALKGRRIALLDLDPLSDAASLLDLQEAEETLSAEPLSDRSRTLADFTVKAFRNLDLLFPSPKLGRGESLELLELIYRRFAAELNRDYELAIFDLPAGSGYEENLAFLPFMKSVILVTNPEPTAHASAGAYLHRLFALYPERRIHVWHNRYTPQSPPGFNPADVAGNYNRNVPEELRLSEAQMERIADLAFVPEDPALNLLHGEPSVRMNARRFLLDTLQFMLEQRLALLAGGFPIAAGLSLIIVGFLCRHKTMEDPERDLERLGEHLRSLAISASTDLQPQAAIFTDEERATCLEFLSKAREDNLRRALVRVILALEEDFHHRGLPRDKASADRALDRELSRLLVALNRLAARERSLAKGGALLLFCFALHKLFRSDTVVRLIGSLVPRRRNSRGQAVRDRRRQIRILVERDPEYRRRYLRLVRLLQPVAIRQIDTVAKAFNLKFLLFREPSGRLARGAYLKLLTNFLHDTLYSGLSVVVGFPYRSAAAAFREGAEQLAGLLSQH